VSQLNKLVKRVRLVQRIA